MGECLAENYKLSTNLRPDNRRTQEKSFSGLDGEFLADLDNPDVLIQSLSNFLDTMCHLDDPRFIQECSDKGIYNLLLSLEVSLVDERILEMLSYACRDGLAYPDQEWFIELLSSADESLLSSSECLLCYALENQDRYEMLDRDLLDIIAKLPHSKHRVYLLHLISRRWPEDIDALEEQMKFVVGQIICKQATAYRDIDIMLLYRLWRVDSVPLEVLLDAIVSILKHCPVDSDLFKAIYYVIMDTLQTGLFTPKWESVVTTCIEKLDLIDEDRETQQLRKQLVDLVLVYASNCKLSQSQLADVMTRFATLIAEHVANMDDIRGAIQLAKLMISVNNPWHRLDDAWKTLYDYFRQDHRVRIMRSIGLSFLEKQFGPQ